MDRVSSHPALAAVGASLLLHVAMGWAAAEAKRPTETGPAPLIEVERLALLESPVPLEPEPGANSPTSTAVERPPRLRAPAPAAKSSAARSSAAAEQMTAAASAAPSSESAPAPTVSEPSRPRFVLGTSRALTTLGEPRDSSAAPVETLSEDKVSVRARLLSGSSAAYPSAARAAEIEADVQVLIVVDAAGRVVSAQVAGHPGYGLEQAALTAVRGYRFSPALLGARPVQVRMLWTVQFRLR